MKYRIEIAPGFKKDFKRVKKQGKNTDEIVEVFSQIAKGEKLERKYRDHKLKGKYAHHRECHINPDLLLIYKIDGAKLILTRIGSHSELFK